jgi:hypothetical protein
MSTSDMLDRAERFIWLNGRLLERRRFAYLFRSGGADDVLTALLPYQNADGGFGNALEPDGRGPSSQPGHVYSALRVLDEIGRCSGPLVTRACDYLASVTAPDGGVPPVLSTILNEPRAPWWNPPSGTPSGWLLPTAGIAGVLHKNRVRHPWLDKATASSWKAIAALKDSHPYEVEYCLAFLEHAPDRDRASKEAERLGRLVRERRIVALDPYSLDDVYITPGYAPGEVFTPLDYAPSPDSLAHRWFSDEEIQVNLDALEKAQRDDGGWPVKWRIWTPITEFDWRPWVTVESLKKLRAYGRLE